jgi:dGTPase
VRSYESRGRAVAEEECRLRTAFQRDRDRIVHCKAFRRLKHKTQVFMPPRGDHFRTRLTHTLEAAGISRVVARALGLNEDLTEAITLGHDLGHPPFGHTGEETLDRVLQARFGRHFRHNEHSLRVVESWRRTEAPQPHREVRDGIVTTRARAGDTEGSRADRHPRRHINHDIDDALRAGIVAETA